jgi:OFA family oxalate/formate antiporter-like MFS transporter
VVVSTFSAMSALAGFGAGFVGRRAPLGMRLALAAALVGGSALAMGRINGPFLAYLAAALFGLGIGCMFTLLPVAWADYFGRRSYGAIRGIALSIQVLAQAAGPLLSGVLRDVSGSYALALWCFAGLATLAAAAALFARPPVLP